jgi:hypothetical protein
VGRAITDVEFLGFISREFVGKEGNGKELIKSFKHVTVQEYVTALTLLAL